MIFRYLPNARTIVVNLPFVRHFDPAPCRDRVDASMFPPRSYHTGNKSNIKTQSRDAVSY
jgi:hypothetical protein